MIKEHCPDCNSIYIGDCCPCRKGKKPRKLECECGKPAKEIYTDKLGEWPLCKECLTLELDEFAPLPLPNYNDEYQEESLTPATGNKIQDDENPLYQNVKNRSHSLLTSAMKKSHSSSSSRSKQ
jgi:hypothetical protein